jgi:hypothetical protein
MRRLIIFVATLALCGFGLSTVIGVAAQRSSIPTSKVSRSAITPTIGSVGPYLGVKLTPEAPPSTAISQQQAILAALQHSFGTQDASGNLASAVTASGQYGLFTNYEYASEPSSSDTQTLIYNNVPAWVITFSGQGVGAPAMGPRGKSVANAASTEPTTEFVVVDGQTGAFLETLN